MEQDNKTDQHYEQQPRRKAEFITPPNLLKSKVGHGGLTDEILDKAQTLLEKSAVDFTPLAEIYLNSLMKGINTGYKALDSGGNDYIAFDNSEEIIAGMLYPAMQLKANGGMFHYPLVTTIGDKLVQFLEVIETPDEDAIEIVSAFHTTIKAVVMGRITGDGGQHGKELLVALSDACRRYFERNPDKRVKSVDYTERF